MLKEVVRAMGLEPETILTREALAEPHRTYANPQKREEEEVRLLGLALRENLKKELLASLNSQRVATKVLSCSKANGIYTNGTRDDNASISDARRDDNAPNTLTERPVVHLARR